MAEWVHRKPRYRVPTVSFRKAMGLGENDTSSLDRLPHLRRPWLSKTTLVGCENGRPDKHAIDPFGCSNHIEIGKPRPALDLQQQADLVIGGLQTIRNAVEAHDLTEQQWRVIRILAEQETVDASEMADKAFILAPSLTRIIRSLEERSIITKHKDDNDGRRVLLQITAAGMAIIHEVAPESRIIYDRLEKHVGRDRIERLLDMLDEVASFNEAK